MRSIFRLLVVAALAVVTSLPALPAAPSPPANYQGLWWNSPPESESGWGINVAHQGDVIFATWFTYDADGHGWWLSMTASKTAEGTYSGILIETAGPAFKSTPFDPARVTRAGVGIGTFVFRDADNGTFTYTVKGVQQSKFITRMAFGPLPTCRGATVQELAAATNYQDLWWAAGGTESGWGLNLTHQGDTIFATWFTYGDDGRPLWLSATATMIGPRIYQGPLVRTAGPAFDAAPFDPAKVRRTTEGTATLTFTSGNAAKFAYTLQGVSQVKEITRLLFAPAAGTRCGEPNRDPAPVSVVAAGDIADCGGRPAAESGAAQTARLVRDGDSLVLALGDLAYESGAPEEFANCFHPTWGAFKDRIRPAPGNHDYTTAGAAGYFDYFGERAGPDRRGYYSFDHAGWHIISLNSVIDFSTRSDQYRWLLEDLRLSRDSLCTIALLHYPPFNSGASYGSAMEMRPIFEALHIAGVEMVLSGHEHLYERFAPQKPDGTADPARGVRQFIVGTGGRTLGEFRGAPLPNSEFRHNSSFGVLRLTLGPGRYGWQFVTAGGVPIDVGSANCHR